MILNKDEIINQCLKNNNELKEELTVAAQAPVPPFWDNIGKTIKSANVASVK